jgi:hypothetical protein
MAQKTAIDWLYNMMLKPLSEWPDDLWEQAKQMEEERAIDMYIAGMKNDMINPLPDSHYRELAERYYEETYGTN